MRRDFRIEATLEHDSGRLATVRLTSPADRDVLVDLLFYFCGPEWSSRRDNRTRWLNVGTCSRRRSSPAELKIFTTSLLLANMKSDEIARATRLVGLAMQRGFGEDRDLVAELTALAARERAAGASFEAAGSARVERMKRRAKR